MHLQAGHAIGLDVLKPILDEARPSQGQGAALHAAIDYMTRVEPDHPWRADLTKRLEEVAQWHRRVQDELNRLDEAAVLEPADLSDAPLAALREQAAAVPGLKGLWLARRRLRVDDNIVQYVVLYAIDGPKTPVVQAFPQAALNVLTAHDNALVIDFNTRTAWLRARLDKLAGAKLMGK